MVKDHSDSEREKPAAATWAILSDKQQGFFYMHHMHKWEIAQWVHHEGSIWWPIAPWANALTTELHLAPCVQKNE